MSEKYAFCAIAEANEKDLQSYSESSQFSRLFHEANVFLQKSNDNENLPLEMAIAIKKVLLKWYEEGFSPNTVLYAGVLVSNREISVCTAGDCRVHLIKDGKIVAVTRDHNAIADPIDGMFIDEKLTSHYLNIVTRSIGVSGERPPECEKWCADADYSVIISSSRFHQYRNPNEYINNFIEGNKPSSFNSFNDPKGVLITLNNVK